MNLGIDLFTMKDVILEFKLMKDIHYTSITSHYTVQ